MLKEFQHDQEEEQDFQSFQSFQEEKEVLIYSVCPTQFTLKGQRNMSNRKPFRSKALKARAKKEAVKTKGGFWTAAVPVQFHPAVKN